MLLTAPGELVEGEVFNLASGQHRCIRAIATDVIEAMQYPEDRVNYIGERPGQVIRHTGDWSKIRRVLGWEPKVTWEDGLEATIGWYRDNRNLWSKQLFMRHIPITTAGGELAYH